MISTLSVYINNFKLKKKNKNIRNYKTTKMELNESFLGPAALMFFYVVFTGSVFLIFGYILFKCNQPSEFEENHVVHEAREKDSRNEIMFSWSSSGRSGTSTNTTKIDWHYISDYEPV